MNTAKRQENAPTSFLIIINMKHYKQYKHHYKHETKLMWVSLSNAKINQVSNEKIVHVRFTQLAWQEQFYNTKIHTKEEIIMKCEPAPPLPYPFIFF